MRQNKTKQLLDYWLTLFRECNPNENASSFPLWPDRRSIQPAQCRSLLSEMFILESFGGPYQYRLAGTNLCSLYGRELKRETFSNTFIGSDRDDAEDWVCRLTLDEQVGLICSLAELETGEKIGLETLLLPLSNSSGSGKRILGISVPHDAGSMGPQGVILRQAIRSVRVLRPWEQKTSFSRASRNSQNVDQVASTENGRIDMAAPSLFLKNDRYSTFSEISNSTHQFRRVGHLMVIDGGRGEEQHKE